MKTILSLIATALLLTSCHWSKELKYQNPIDLNNIGKIRIKVVAGLQTSYYHSKKPQATQQTWQFILTDIISKDTRFTLVSSQETIRMEIDVSPKFINIICYGTNGKIILARCSGNNNYSDRQKGIAYLKGINQKKETIKSIINELFKSKAKQK